MGDWAPPPWVDAIWKDVQGALARDEDDSLWRRALQPQHPVIGVAVYVRAWREFVGGSSSWRTLAAALTVWWWEQTGEDIHPTPQQVEEQAEHHMPEPPKEAVLRRSDNGPDGQEPQQPYLVMRPEW